MQKNAQRNGKEPEYEKISDWLRSATGPYALFSRLCPPQLTGLATAARGHFEPDGEYGLVEALG
jgi:hypothetical protein